ncbi:DMT family transporter [Aerococcus urinae]|uniref:DMT family transporter n=1 Tax=Aerococcus urinae TaxID=1376 RepID=UPI0018A7D7B6|nr:DMT family transporter [Aerococcus urinae]
MHIKSGIRKRAIITTILAYSSWGLGGVLSQHLMQTYNMLPLQLTMYRMLTAGISIFLFLAYKKKLPIEKLKQDKRSLLQIAIFGICGIVFNQFSYLMTIHYSNSGMATILQFIGPIFLLVYYCLVGRRWPIRREIVALLFTIIGVFLLVTHGQLGHFVLSTEAFFWGLMSAFGLALYNILPLRVIEHYGSLPVTGIGMLFGGIFLIFFNIERLAPPELSLHFLAWFTLTIIVGTIVPYIFYLSSVTFIGPLAASLIGSVEPLTATILSVMILGESFVWIDYLGMAFILLTVFLTAHE